VTPSKVLSHRSQLFERPVNTHQQELLQPQLSLNAGGSAR